jgi:predicted DNA-binding transcriptional regulator AlpA
VAVNTFRETLLASATAARAQSSSAPRVAAIRANRAEARALVDDPLLTARESAAETGRALSTFWRDVRNGVLPRAQYILPRAPRWRRSELRAAIEAAPRMPSAR